MVGDDPERAGSIDRSSVVADVRLFHLELAAGRRGAAAHCLFYTRGRMSNGEAGVIVLRVLHEAMEPRYKLLRSLNQYEPRFIANDMISISSRPIMVFSICMALNRLPWVWLQSRNR